MSDHDAELVKAIADTKRELEESKEVIRALANELGEVADIIEPALAGQAERIRRVRMSTLDEVRQVVAGLKELRDAVGNERTERAIANGERLLAVCRELEEFRASGFLDAFLKAFAADYYGLKR